MTVTHKRPIVGEYNEAGVKYHCDICGNDVTLTVRIKCAICDDLDFCASCFCQGKEVGSRHKAWHDYRVVERHSYPLFTEDWGADEELLLLEGATLYGLGNWADIADHIGSRTKEEVQEHYYAVYLQNDTCLPQEAEVKVTLEEFNIRKKARIETLRAQPPPLIPAIPPKPLTSAPTNHEVAGFMPGRLEFEHEPEQDAETSIKDLEFAKVLDFGGDLQPEGPPPPPPLEPLSKEALEAEAEANEVEDPEDLKFKLAILDIYAHRLQRRINAKSFVLDRSLVEYKRVQAAERKRPKDERDFLNRLKTFAKLQTADDYESFVDGLSYELTLKKRIAELQEYRRMGCSNFIEAETYEKDKLARAMQRPLPPVRDSAAHLMNNDRQTPRSRSILEDTMSPGDTTFTKSSSRKTPLLTLATSSSLDLLSPEEQILCSESKMLPKSYLVVKQALLREYLKLGSAMTQQDACSSLSAVKEDKVIQVWKLLIHAGWVTTHDTATPMIKVEEITDSITMEVDDL